MEYLTYSVSCGFNIIEAEDEQSAEMFSGQDSTTLDPLDEIDPIIVERIRELLDNSDESAELRRLKELEQIAYAKYHETCGCDIADWLDEGNREEYAKLMKKHFDVEV